MWDEAGTQQHRVTLAQTHVHRLSPAYGGRTLLHVLCEDEALGEWLGVELCVGKLVDELYRKLRRELVRDLVSKLVHELLVS